MIRVSRREFEKGWTRARAGYTTIAGGPKINNAHRLLLFYAVENGLKALIMRQERDDAADFSGELHNLNRLLDRARALKSLKLPSTISLKSENANLQRKCGIGEVNQVWRYGCVAQVPSDSDLEANLKCVAEWIEQQLVNA